MSASRVQITSLLAAAWFALTAAAAPVPVGTPASAGGDLGFPAPARQGAARATSRHPPPLMPEEGVLRIGCRVLTYQATERVSTEYVTVAKEVTEVVRLPGGPVKEVKRVVMEMMPVQRKVVVQVPVARLEMATMKAEACKFFAVAEGGKLEALDRPQRRRHS